MKEIHECVYSLVEKRPYFSRTNFINVLTKTSEILFVTASGVTLVNSVARRSRGLIKDRAAP